jgi:hypothetical protein
VTDRTDLDALFKFVMPFARSLMAQHGEFYPFSALLDRSGEPQGLSVAMDDEHPSSKEVQASLEGALRRKADACECRAVALCVNARVAKPEGTIDAIVVYLEHESGLALEVGVPYTLGERGVVTYGEVSAAHGRPRFMRAPH